MAEELERYRDKILTLLTFFIAKRHPDVVATLGEEVCKNLLAALSTLSTLLRTSDDVVASHNVGILISELRQIQELSRNLAGLIQGLKSPVAEIMSSLSEGVKDIAEALESLHRDCAARGKGYAACMRPAIRIAAQRLTELLDKIYEKFEKAELIKGGLLV